MANVTFRSPAMRKDVTVYAVAGDRHTILGLAQKNTIPVHCECQNGECGSCAVRVVHLGEKAPMAAHLTEKEKTVLVLIGKLKKQDLAEIEVRDLAPDWRLACQYMLLDEDIVVNF